jgi:hypothetical protein
MLNPFSLPSWLYGLLFGAGLRFVLYVGLAQGAEKLGWQIKNWKLMLNAVAQAAVFLSMSRRNIAVKRTCVKSCAGRSLPRWA